MLDLNSCVTSLAFQDLEDRFDSWREHSLLNFGQLVLASSVLLAARDRDLGKYDIYLFEEVLVMCTRTLLGTHANTDEIMLHTHGRLQLAGRILLTQIEKVEIGPGQHGRLLFWLRS